MSFWAGFEKRATDYFVYRNLHKGKDKHVYSLRNKATGRVEDHVRKVREFKDPVFKVSDKGRKRVISEGRKNVHAGIEASTGRIEKNLDWKDITYDPKKHKSFVFRDSGEPVTGDARAIRLTPKGVMAGFYKAAAATKAKYRELDINTLDPTDKSEAWSAKIDGAHALVELRKGKTPRLYSHRISKRTGERIEYTKKLPHLKGVSAIDANLRAEVYAVGPDGRAVHPDMVTAMLNRTLPRSLSLQRERRMKTKTALIDVNDIGGKSMAEAAYPEKHKVLAEISRLFGKTFHMPSMAFGAKAKANLKKRIEAGEHPQTKEGLIVHDMTGKKKSFAKAKISADHDVYVRKIFKETDTKEGRNAMAGGFEYSWTPDGKIVGKVGTGFNHAMKKDMLNNPDDYIGRVALARALDVSKNKVLVKPSFKGWHVDKNID